MILTHLEISDLGWGGMFDAFERFELRHHRVFEIVVINDPAERLAADFITHKIKQNRRCPIQDLNIFNRAGFFYAIPNPGAFQNFAGAKRNGRCARISRLVFRVGLIYAGDLHAACAEQTGQRQAREAATDNTDIEISFHGATLRAFGDKKKPHE